MRLSMPQAGLACGVPDSLSGFAARLCLGGVRPVSRCAFGRDEAEFSPRRGRCLCSWVAFVELLSSVGASLALFECCFGKLLPPDHDAEDIDGAVRN